jgi:hypothetical protein
VILRLGNRFTAGGCCGVSIVVGSKAAVAVVMFR